MKRLFAISVFVLLAAPSLAQQAPQPVEPELGRNYNQLPFVYDLVERLKPQPPVRILDPKDQALSKRCEAKMMRELRRSGLAEKGKAVYRDCAGKLGAPHATPSSPQVAPAQ
jgi:hypothetical protein